MILWFYRFLYLPSTVFLPPSRWIPANLIVPYIETIWYILGFLLRVYHCLWKVRTGFLQSSQKFSLLWEKQLKHTDCNPLLVKETKFCKVFEGDLIGHSGIEAHNTVILPAFRNTLASSWAKKQCLATEINGKSGHLKTGIHKNPHIEYTKESQHKVLKSRHVFQLSKSFPSDLVLH